MFYWGIKRKWHNKVSCILINDNYYINANRHWQEYEKNSGKSHYQVGDNENMIIVKTTKHICKH